VPVGSPPQFSSDLLRCCCWQPGQVIGSVLVVLTRLEKAICAMNLFHFLLYCGFLATLYSPLNATSYLGSEFFLLLGVNDS